MSRDVDWYLTFYYELPYTYLRPTINVLVSTECFKTAHSHFSYTRSRGLVIQRPQGIPLATEVVISIED